MLDRLIHRVSELVGSQAAMVLTVVAAIIAFVVGRATKFSSRWEQIVVVASAFVTLFIVVAIRHTQRQDSRAMQIKLDELIRAVENAKEDVASVERASHEELQEIRDRTQSAVE